MLIAAGEFQVFLVSNIYAATWIVVASLAGYYFFGFMGFVYGVALSGFPPLIYYLYLQRKKDILIVRYELYRVAFAIGVALTAYWASSLILLLWPGGKIKI
jgi:hypothetical protein